jgi:hypothetical protein
MKTIILTLIISILFRINLSSKENTFQDHPELKEKVDAYAYSYLMTGDFSGCISINKGDSIIYQQCFGNANQPN